MAPVHSDKEAVYTEILQTSKPKTIMSERPKIVLQSLRFCVNGPFASPLEEIISLKQVVCIGAGIGITPFAAVLRFLLERDDRKFPERINLIWLTPDPNQILWFAWTISSLHTKCWEQNKPDRFHFSIHVTRNLTQTFVTRQYPLVACRIHTGRPVWTDVFQQLRNENTDGIVHVFGCGSRKLTRTLARHCERTSCQPGGPTFRFVREAYS
ncbi:hypothetical protein B566_EDAN001274 [Ephemera danica]|nr:hypothetical protein B566_EDAN001274 [Ephemera danica]